MGSHSFEFAHLENRYDASIERRWNVHLCFYVGTHTSFYEPTRWTANRLCFCSNDDGNHDRRYGLSSLAVDDVEVCTKWKGSRALRDFCLLGGLCQYCDSGSDLVSRSLQRCGRLYHCDCGLYGHRSYGRFVHARGWNPEIEVRSRRSAGCNSQYFPPSLECGGCCRNPRDGSFGRKHLLSARQRSFLGGCFIARNIDVRGIIHKHVNH
mmetsp:Transcript_28555/g.77279  ORF Transcript_28555/g.77279 Transcript_28555/m.77279 type:complete len:209 (-) Transcript_28555:358-984(-)